VAPDDGCCGWVVREGGAQRCELASRVVRDEESGCHLPSLARGEVVAVGPVAPGVEGVDATLNEVDGFGVGESSVEEVLASLLVA
jgi:hypothetical protein